VREIFQEVDKHTHTRFKAFEEMATCQQTCVGGACSNDQSKIVCGLDNLKQQNEKCVIYSIGGNNWWKFELDLLEHLPMCEIHTFDCTGPRSRFQVPKGIHFHHVCLGTKNVPAPPTSAKPESQRSVNDIVGEFWTLEKFRKRSITVASIC